MPPTSKQLHLAHRREAFRSLLRDRRLDGYLLSNPSDLFYLTDFRSEGYYGLVTRDDAYLFLPTLLHQQAQDATRGFTCLKSPFFPTLRQLISRHRLKALGFDSSHVTFDLGQSLRKEGARPVSGLVSGLRKIKDPEELDRLRAANHLAARGISFLKKHLRPGMTEKAAAADLARFFSVEGDGIAFDLIIAGGPNGAYPHHVSSLRPLRRGEGVICDIGATWAGYRSDLTRTLPLGRMPGLFSRVFRIVEKSQLEGIRCVRPGVTAGEVDQACRAVIARAGYGKYFVHSTGHGVGIDIHEAPRIGPKSPEKLEAGMVVTVEPGVYLPGRLGVRIEDTLLVRDSGAEVLTV